jgi:hypothetical protein
MMINSIGQSYRGTDEYGNYKARDEYGNTTIHMSAPACQSKLRDFGDELILTEKNDEDNDIYRNALTGSAQSACASKYLSGVLDMTLLVTNKNENSCFIGTLSNENDVDYYRVNTLSQFLSKRPVYITMDMPEGCDYNMSVYDKDGNQVGMAAVNGDGTKTVKVPCDWSSSNDFVIKIEKADGTEVKSDEQYKLTFKQGDMPEEVKKRLESSNKCKEISSFQSVDSESSMSLIGPSKAKREEQNRKDIIKLHDADRIHIEISSVGEIEVTGLSEEDNKKVSSIIKEHFMHQLKNAYLNNSAKIDAMSNMEYRIAGFAEELDRFLAKVSGGNTTVDDLSIDTSKNENGVETTSITGLPSIVANLINNADAVSKYYDYQQMIYDVQSYKNSFGTIPRYDVSMDWTCGDFNFA